MRNNITTFVKKKTKYIQYCKAFDLEANVLSSASKSKINDTKQLSEIEHNIKDYQG